MQNDANVPILKSSRTTYFDSLTGITESESGKSSEALKITGLPELTKTKSRERQTEREIKIRYYQKLLIFTESNSGT